jgi:hypothetical protein
MRHRTDINLVELDVNHYEVVVSPTAVAIISEHIKKAPATK